jgi:signal transduction histidine kinase/ABC-type nitrate/sulfonate/bicarbonate transport system substrate-binding protein/ABC-type amino acid transport substrate-binding protein
MRATFLLSLLLSFFFAFPVHAKTLTQINLQLQWKHQFEFAGFYAAIEKGFYQEAGLEVQLYEYREGIDLIGEVISGRKQFGIWGDGVLRAYMQGKPLVQIANYFKRSPLILVTRPEIRSPDDLRGKKVMISSMDAQSAGYLQMLRKFKIDPSEITIIPPSFNIQDFIDDKVDAYLAFSTNEPFVHQQQGVSYNVLDFNTYGAELYDVNLFTSQEYALANPEKVQAFVIASNRGWGYALKHPEEVIDLILKRYNSQQKSREALLFEYRESLNSILQDTYPIGSIDIEKIRTMGNVFAQNGLAVPSKNYQGFIFTPWDHSVGDEKSPEESQHRKTPVQFSEEEQAYLRAKGSIKMCVDPDWMPFEQINADGKHEGMSADLLKMMQQRSGVNLELVPTTSWSESIEKAKTRQCDIYSLAMPTPERMDYMDFTTPYLSFPFVIATRSDKVFVERIEQVLDKPLALVKGYAYTEILKKRYPETRFVEVDNLKAGLQLLRKNSVYGYIDALAPIAYTLQKEGMSEIKIAGKFDDSWELGIGTRKDEPLLLAIMQKMSHTVSGEEKRASYNNWFSVKFESYIDYSMVWKVLFGGLALCTIILYWTRKLYAARNETQLALNKLEISRNQLKNKHRDLDIHSQKLSLEIEERRQAEKQLRMERDNLKTIFETMTDGVYIVNEQYDISYVNSVLVKDFGVYEGEKCYEYLHGRTDPCSWCKNRTVFEGETIHWEWNSEKNGKTYDIIATPIINKDNTISKLQIFRDITEQVKMKEQLFLNEKLETIAGLAAGVAHEINTPLSAIIQAHQLVEIGLSPEDESSREKAAECAVDLVAVQDYFKKNELDFFMDGIRESALKAGNIIKNLLDFSRPQEGCLTTVNLKDIVESSLLLSQTDYQMKKKYGIAGVKFIKEYSLDCPPVVCVAPEIEQVIMHFIKNSVLSMAEVEQTKKPCIILRTSTMVDRAVIEVEDNGPGIPRDIKNNIFDPFFTTREVGTGTGLGLSVAHAIIVDKHKGSIRVESEPGQGAKFIVELPLTQAERV